MVHQKIYLCTEYKEGYMFKEKFDNESSIYFENVNKQTKNKDGKLNVKHTNTFLFSHVVVSALFFKKKNPKLVI